MKTGKKAFLTVLKWEARKWYQHFHVFFMLAAAHLLVVFLLPVPHDDMHRLVHIIAGSANVVVVMPPVFIAVYMIVAYPLYLILLSEMLYSVFERSSGIATGWFLGVRLAISAVTAAVGWGLAAAIVFVSRDGLVALDLPFVSEFMADVGVFPFEAYIPHIFLMVSAWLPAVLFGGLTLQRMGIKNRLLKLVGIFAIFFVGVSTGRFMVVGLRGESTPLEWVIRFSLAIAVFAVSSVLIDRRADLEVASL